MKDGIRRSPLFYVGDKYKLMKEIGNYFPKDINRFYEPFVGGGSVFINTKAKAYYLNDLNSYVVGLHKFLYSYKSRKEIFYDSVFSLIDNYGLSCSFLRDEIPNELKKQYVKTYFARYNKQAYSKLKADYNANECSDYLKLYVLLIYGFNHMLRFNANGKFNLPVGNVDFNKNTFNALEDYFSFTDEKEAVWFCEDYKKFLASFKFGADDFVYADPPYLISSSEYNKLWDEDEERQLLGLIDELDKANVKFALSNVTHYKGRENTILIEWSRKYNVIPIKSNYISYHDNSAKQIQEVLITNYS